MNFQSSPVLPPLKVLLINSLSSPGQLVVTKILSGLVFGSYQLVDLILLVYTNEKAAAEELKLEMKLCAFSCMNSIEISSDLPGYNDADVFLFLCNFKNPYHLDIKNIDIETFDKLYLVMKIAHGLVMPEPKPPEDLPRRRRNYKEEPVPRKKLIWGDGLLALDIIKSVSKGLPNDIFLTPTPLNGMSKTILAEYLKTECSSINHVYVWAASDEIFHVEVEKPYVIHDTREDQTHCDWDMIGRELLDTINLDHTQFNESWMKKEYLDKMAAASISNPYGDIGRAAVFTIGLRFLWTARADPDGTPYYRSLGTISDGSLGIIKGYPCIIPLILIKDTIEVNKVFLESYHLRQEIKRINKKVKEHHEELLRYCKKFVQENIINQEFIPEDSSVATVSTTVLTPFSRSNTNLDYIP